MVLDQFCIEKVDRRLAGIECIVCNKIFASLFRYDQRRRSDDLRETACSALPDENRTNLYAVSRPNMSMASLLRRPAHRRRGGAVNTTREKPQITYPCRKFIFCIFHIFLVFCIFCVFKPSLPAEGRQGLRLHILHF